MGILSTWAILLVLQASTDPACTLPVRASASQLHQDLETVVGKLIAEQDSQSLLVFTSGLQPRMLYLVGQDARLVIEVQASELAVVKELPKEDSREFASRLNWALHYPSVGKIQVTTAEGRRLWDFLKDAAKKTSQNPENRISYVSDVNRGLHDLVTELGISQSLSVQGQTALIHSFTDLKIDRWMRQNSLKLGAAAAGALGLILSFLVYQESLEKRAIELAYRPFESWTADDRTWIKSHAWIIDGSLVSSLSRPIEEGIYTKEAEPLIFWMLESEDPSLRIAAIRNLRNALLMGEVSESDVTLIRSRLRNLSQDPDPRVHWTLADFPWGK